MISGKVAPAPELGLDVVARSHLQQLSVSLDCRHAIQLLIGQMYDFARRQVVKFSVVHALNYIGISHTPGKHGPLFKCFETKSSPTSTSDTSRISLVRTHHEITPIDVESFPTKKTSKFEAVHHEPLSSRQPQMSS